MRRSWLSSTLTATVSIALGLAAMEVATRFLAPQQLVRDYVLPDHDLGSAHRPGADYHDRYGNDYHVRINAHGFRMDEEVDPSPGRRRVLVYGDSFTFGWGVEADLSFFTALKRVAENMDPRVQLLNAGVGGYSTGHVKILLERHRTAVAPAAAVYFFNSNDIIDNAVADPDYRVAEYRVGSGGTIAIADTPPFSRWKRFALHYTPYGWLNRHSHLFVMAKDVFKRGAGVQLVVERPSTPGAPAPVQAPASGTLAVSDAPAFTVTKAQAEAAETRSRELVALSAAHVRRLVAAAHGLPLLIVWIPAEEEIFTPSQATPLYAAMRAELARMAKEGGFAFVDSTTLIAHDTTAALAGKLHFAGDGHFNADGNAWFAELIRAPVTAFATGHSL